MVVGYRFAPKNDELINHYLRNKNLGNTELVDHVISEINICSFEPDNLPALAKMNTKDLVWYFFSPIKYANSKKTTMKRSTCTGFWKPTGKDRIIKDEIGIKKTLVYHKGKAANGVRTPWVMHEYHITSLPPHLTTYVLCQVKYKGDHRDISYGANDWVVPHSDIGREINTVEVDQPVQDGLNLNELSNPLNVQEDLCPLDAMNPNLLQQTPEVEQPDGYDPNTDILMKDLLSPGNVHEYYYPLSPNEFDPDSFFNFEDGGNYGGSNNDAVIVNQEFSMQENRNVYTTRKSLSGTISCSSDSEDSAESISATSYQGPSSSHDSVGSSSSDSCNDLQTSADLLVNRKSRKYKRRRRTIPSKQEMKRGTSRAIDASIVKTEKETMETNLEKPWFIYVINRIIGFILLVGLILFLRFVSIVNIRKTHDIRTTHQENEVVDASIDKEPSMVKTEKETKETNLKKLRFIYPMNMIIGFILLIGFIGNIKYWNLV